MLEAGDRVYIITRRKFDGDLRRHFVGELLEYSDSQCLAAGYVFVLNEHSGQYTKRPDRRTRLFPLGDRGLIINVIPDETVLEDVVIRPF